MLFTRERIVAISAPLKAILSESIAVRFFVTKSPKTGEVRVRVE